MSIFSKISGYSVGKFKNSKNNVAIHESVSGGKPQTSMSGFAPGLECSPADGENIVITKIEGSNSFVISIGGTNQNIAPDTNRGERRIYSVSEDGKEIKAVAKFKNDGVLELNGATDSAVLYSELETSYNELNDKFNALISVLEPIFTGSPILEPGNGSPSALQAAILAAWNAAYLTFVPPVTTLESTGDITPAESADVKLS